MGHVSTHRRPQSPDFLEIRLERHRTTIFPCGLPFHQRAGGRMLDVILMPAGEHALHFDLAIGLDREQPMQTALGLITPAIVVPTVKGPPHVGAKGWLFHLDASNLLLTSMRPGGQESLGDGSNLAELPDAVTARLVECAGYSTPAELRCVRDPVKVTLLDGRGQALMPGTHQGDAALFHAGPGSLIQLQVQFSS
jgi:alpha-mannosidase